MEFYVIGQHEIVHKCGVKRSIQFTVFGAPVLNQRPFLTVF